MNLVPFSPQFAPDITVKFDCIGNDYKKLVLQDGIYSLFLVRSGIQVVFLTYTTTQAKQAFKDYANTAIVFKSHKVHI